MVTNDQTNKQPGEPGASLLVEHWKQTSKFETLIKILTIENLN